MATALWEPDILLAIQYASMRESRQRSPEKRLLIAVLKSALNDYQEAVRAGGRRHQLHDLEEWFFAGDDSWPFSFENLCTQLDLSPECIRANLAALAGGRHGPPRRGP